MEQPTKIIAIITTKPENVLAGGAPIFITKDAESLQNTSSMLEKTLDASAHEVNEDTMIIVAH
ncbi:hypothetical protein M670_04614 [Schinkia azotoformans MEV2011]|uniref:Uncharacterized protein n=2 Tax=Schinkia azotoformans TaxID=1454 RepID=K6E9V6_SCHAZ|nr:hypothetical protein [Schinkia azotoformans]EKN70156.1 hypothetical protein BAZO_01472 [Schinkia azotoformans LMG 9581]KEF36233.1 hypothetical protein M670_04614 [Schinkia azotoformans MEV2011]MEC1636991.1 hypothetical protein [Schinkia azotoformans]MEC1693906.1 hypothetical protein [Schinkia azotoformans]MEC1718625.1 hypothetical protein [Schinkia azotoformans]